MTRKRKGLLLLALYFVLIALAIPLHTQKGIEWNDRFYAKTAEGVFSAGKNNQFSFAQTPDGLQFDMTVNGQSYQALMAKLDDNAYQFDFSDGWLLKMVGDYTVPCSIIANDLFFILGDVETTFIVTDADSPAYQFAAYEVEHTPFFDSENKQQLGEWIIYRTTDGEHIHGYELWFDQSQPAYEPTFVTLKNGTEVSLSSRDSLAIYVNEKGEALLNDELLFSFPGNDMSDAIGKQSYILLLLNAVHDNVSARGHFACFLLSLLYLLGLLQFLFPEETAFFGHRWQYRYEPELSDSGLFMAQLGGVIIMVMGAALLYLPLVMR